MPSDIREQLLDATVRVVSELGWRGATTRRIAEEAGVNEVTLFRHFGSKDSLICEAMAWNADQAPVPALPDEPGDDVGDELLRWADQHYAHLVDIRGHLRRTIGEFERHPDAAAWPRRVPTRLGRALEHYLIRLRETGRAHGDWDPRAAASMLLGTLFADAIGRDFMPDRLPAPAVEAPRRYIDLFLAAIGHRPVTP